MLEYLPNTIEIVLIIIQIIAALYPSSEAKLVKVVVTLLVFILILKLIPLFAMLYPIIAAKLSKVVATRLVLALILKLIALTIHKRS